MIAERIKGMRRRPDLEDWETTCFSGIERPEIGNLVKRGDLIAYYMHGIFTGATYSTLIDNDTAFLYYFGLLPVFRDKGYGSRIISECLKKRMYGGCNIVLLIKNPFRKGYNDDFIRQKRLAFYTKNGFKPLYEYNFMNEGYSRGSDNSFFGMGLEDMPEKEFLKIVKNANEFFNQ